MSLNKSRCRLCDRCEPCDEEKVSLAMKIILDSQSEIITQAKSDITNLGAQHFAANEVTKCFSLVQAYSKAFRELQVENMEQFDHAVSHCFSNEEIRDLYETRLENEKEWEDMLKDVDSLTNPTGESLQLGDKGPMDYSVVNVVSGAQTTLKAIANGRPLLLETFVEMDWKVLIVSFGVKEGAERWRKDTLCPFEVVVDADRKIYHVFGLQRSVARVWNFPYMAFYGEMVISGRTLPKPYERMSDDAIQMGGDFLLDCDGTVVMTHPSKVPTDRPTVSQILKDASKLRKFTQL